MSNDYEITFSVPASQRGDPAEPYTATMTFYGKPEFANWVLEALTKHARDCGHEGPKMRVREGWKTWNP